MIRIRIMAAGVLSLSLSLAMATTAVATTITAAPVATDIAGALSTLLPTVAPASTEDTADDSTLSAICQSNLFAAFFLHAAPSGDLASALTSYGSVLTSQACTASATVTGTPTADCSPAPSLWCDFPNDAPSSVLANYTSYGRAAASFLPSGLSPLLALATECPQAWYAAATMFPQGPDDLRDLVVLGECFATARDGSAATGTVTGAVTTTGTGMVTTSGTGKALATATGKVTGSPKPSSGADGRVSSSLALLVAVVACLLWTMLVL